MYIAIFKNQNQAVKVSGILKRRSLYAEVIATPRKYAVTGSCSYCLKFQSKDIDKVRMIAKEAGIHIESIYRL